MASNTENTRNNVLDKFNVKGKTIVITGGNRGLGLSFGNALAQVGANIAAIDLNDGPSAEFQQFSSFGGTYKHYKANVVDYEQLKQTIERVHRDFGSIDGCIPAAGIIRNRPLLEHTEKDFRDTIDVNFNGVFFTVQHCAAKMVEQKTGGSITIVAYTAPKYAVRGIAKQAAHELAPHNIRVNSISPGTMLTEMLEEVMKQTPGRRKLFEDSCAMKRLATPDELSGIMLYLMSEASSYTTGQDFLVDGGLV